MLDAPFDQLPRGIESSELSSETAFEIGYRMRPSAIQM